MKSYVSLSLDGVKHVYIIIKNIKYLMKNFFIEPFDRDFTLFSTFVRILKSTIMCHLKCRSIKFEIRLWRLLRSLGDPKHIGLGMNNKKKFWWKRFFQPIFWPKFDIFQVVLKKSRVLVLSFGCLLLPEICLWKSFTVSTWCETCSHWNKENKKILLKKIFSSKFLTQIWHFPMGFMWEKMIACQLQVLKKKFEAFFQKSASTVLSGLIWRTD